MIHETATIHLTAVVHETAHIGAHAHIEADARVESNAHIGAHARVGAGARAVLADLGAEQVRGFARLAYVAHDGTVRLTAGCRDFSLTEAEAHWGVSYGNRKIGDEYLALVRYVRELAAIAGLEGKP